MSDEHTDWLCQQHEAKMFRDEENYWFPDDPEPEIDEDLEYRRAVDLEMTLG